jgi:hypothetical protein
MPFTPDNAKVVHYSGTTKEATEVGYERSDMPADDGSQNTGRLTGDSFRRIRL